MTFVISLAELISGKDWLANWEELQEIYMLPWRKEDFDAEDAAGVWLTAGKRW